MFKKVISSIILSLALFVGIMQNNVVLAEEVYDVPSGSVFKSYMDYRKITNTRSVQYKIQQECTTDSNGIRVYKDRYCIALGNGFGIKCGDFVDVELEDGTILPCVIGDVKQNIHTDGTNMQVAHNGNVVEFIVDKNALPKKVRSRGSLHVLDGFDGDVVTITVYNGDEASLLTQGLVINKYELELSEDEVVYVVEYFSDTDYNSMCVDEDTYKELIVLESVIDTDTEGV